MPSSLNFLLNDFLKRVFISFRIQNELLSRRRFHQLDCLFARIELGLEKQFNKFDWHLWVGGENRSLFLIQFLRIIFKKEKSVCICCFEKEEIVDEWDQEQFSSIRIVRNSLHSTNTLIRMTNKPFVQIWSLWTVYCMVKSDRKWTYLTIVNVCFYK